jgi:uncharacterized protein with PQ loop repeat
VITKTILENVLIIVAEAFWLSSNYSQLRKLFKTRNTKGLYAPTQALNAAGNIAWATYFASRNLWVPFSTNLAMIVLTTITLARLLGNKKQFAKGLISIVILGPLTAYLIIKYPNTSGWLGVIYNTVASTPWLIHVVKTKRTSGLSEKSLYFALGAMLCTLTYALLISSIPLIAGCVQGLLYLVVVARFYYRYRHI